MTTPAGRAPRALTILVAIHSRFAGWNIPPACLERLRRAFPHHRFLQATTDAGTLELVSQADVVFTSELRPAHLAAARRLQWVHSPAAGVGSMLFPAMLQSDALLTNSRGISARTIAEHVLCVTLALFRKLPIAFRAQQSGRWAQDEMLDAPPIRTVEGAAVLVVGLGAIGGAAAGRFAALGARVTGIRRRAAGEVVPGVSGIEPPERLIDLLPHADVVVMAAPLTAATRAMIDEQELAAMRRDAVLVNVSRGKLIDETALATALSHGRPGAAALDVFEHEPLSPASPLWALPNVLITPHASGFRPDHWDAVTALFLEQLQRYDRGEPLLNVVDKAAGY